VVRVPGKEAGLKIAQVVLVHLVALASLEKFESSSAARLSSKSMLQVEGVLRTVLQL